MTLPRLRSLILEGRGIGVGDQYRPWIQLTKRNTSTCSNQSAVPLPGLSRWGHFLSRGERHLAHTLWWIGAEDVREQYPLWPWAHVNPHTHVAPDADFPQHPGMSAVARDAGIREARYQGLSIPAVLTLDLLVTLPVEIGASPRLLGISCKPSTLYTESLPSDRLRERLELDRRYCLAGGIDHLLVHPEGLPPVLIKQLEWLAPLVPRPKLAALVESRSYRLFIERLAKHAFEIPAQDAADIASRSLHWARSFAQFAMRTAMWRLDINVDLSRPISMASPLRTGGGAIRNELRRRLFGAAAWN